MNEFPLLNENEGIPLFYPNVPKKAIDQVADTLSGRWIGQGPKVDKFENEFKTKFLGSFEPLSVGSGTDALHIAYLLAGLKKDDEVLVPVFTCTATNIPLLYIGCKIKFIDICPETLNVSVDDIKAKISSKTKAIVCVDYGGVPCDYENLNLIAKKFGIPLISDAAHSLGSIYAGKNSGQLADFTIFSFQAIKTLTTGDGGMVSIKNTELVEKGKKLRWFGIDRSAKQKGIWENDIVDIGYKYQMNDIAAGIGLAGMEQIDEVLMLRNKLFKIYEEELSSQSAVKIVGKSATDKYFNSAWLLTLLVDSDRLGLMRLLREHNIESAQVHYRNDRYSIFGKNNTELPVMDQIEDRYLVVPLHTKMNQDNVKRICSIIKQGW